MFSNWEAQFETWKKANANNPDQEYVNNYVSNMNAMKERLLERRKNLQAKVEEQSPSKAPSYYTAASKQPEPGPSKSRWQSEDEKSFNNAGGPSSSYSSLASESLETGKSISDIVKAAVSTFGKKTPQSQPQNQPPMPPPIIEPPGDGMPSGDGSFFGESKGPDGIPGLDEEAENSQEEPQIVQPGLSEEDRAKIARALDDPEEEEDVPAKRFKRDPPQMQARQQPWQQRQSPKDPEQQWQSRQQPQNRNQQWQPRNQPQGQGQQWQQRQHLQDREQPWQPSQSHPVKPKDDQLFSKRNPNDAWKEREELFMNPDDGNEDDLFERRDNKSSELGSTFWNPTAKVVDYGHGGGGNKGFQPTVHDYSGQGNNRPSGAGPSHSNEGYRNDGPSGQYPARNERFGNNRPWPNNNRFGNPNDGWGNQNDRFGQQGEDRNNRFGNPNDRFNNPHNIRHGNQNEPFGRNERFNDRFGGNPRFQQRDHSGPQDNCRRSQERYFPSQDEGYYSNQRDNYQGGYQTAQHERSKSPAFASTSAHRQPSSAPKAPQGEVLQVDDLINPPGRYMRPPKVVVIFRGLPGSGKSFVARNIKTQEASLGSDVPRILALDDYFECDGEVSKDSKLSAIYSNDGLSFNFKYEYEEELEDSYRASLIKSFKKQVDDGYFSFIMVDCINNLNKHYEDIWSYAKQKGFEVFTTFRHHSS